MAVDHMAVDQEPNGGGGGGVSSDNSGGSANNPLTWRMDPALSYSDWKIEVFVLPQGEHHCTYHVHKTVLAVGPKRSEYFYHLFQSSTGFAESSESTSRVQLHGVAAKAFPVFLDYLYSSPNELFKIEYKDSAPLYHFSDYFEIPSLCQTVETMWQDPEIPCSSLGVLYEHSKIFQIDKLKEAIIEACCHNTKSIGKDSSLAQVADSEFWLDVIEKNGGTPNPELCSLVADYCASNIENVDVYQRLLLEEGQFKAMSIETALKFLDIEQTTAHHGGGVANVLSRIQNKCIEVLAASWQQLDTVALAGSFAKLDRAIVDSIFNKTLQKAKADFSKSCMPSKIVVSGAGCSAVNGTYFSRLREDGSPMYEKRGHWNGRDVAFSLFPCQMRSQTYRWFLSILDSEQPGTDRDIDFYYSAVIFPSMTREPPVSDWKTRRFGQGINPVPSFEFLYE